LGVLLLRGERQMERKGREGEGVEEKGGGG